MYDFLKNNISIECMDTKMFDEGRIFRDICEIVPIAWVPDLRFIKSFFENFMLQRLECILSSNFKKASYVLFVSHVIFCQVSKNRRKYSNGERSLETKIIYFHSRLAKKNILSFLKHSNSCLTSSSVMSNFKK